MDWLNIKHFDVLFRLCNNHIIPINYVNISILHFQLLTGFALIEWVTWNSNHLWLCQWPFAFYLNIAKVALIQMWLKTKNIDYKFEFHSFHKAAKFWWKGKMSTGLSVITNFRKH
jgi:hypothetical protein